MYFQKKYNLRSKDVPAEPKRNDSAKKPTSDTPSMSQLGSDNTTKSTTKKMNSKVEVPKGPRRQDEKRVEKR
jgi:hypothetical protein